MNKDKFSEKVATDLKENSCIDFEEIGVIERVFKQSEGNIAISADDSVTLDSFIEKSLNYFCAEYMTICRNSEDMADLMILKRHLDLIRNGLDIDESVVDRFNNLYL